MNTEESLTPPVTIGVEAQPLSMTDHSFQSGYDWSKDTSLPRVNVVNTFYSTLIVPRKKET